MLIGARPIAVKVAVTAFFVVGFVGWASGLSSFACCKRALCGALVMYVATAAAVKMFNRILLNALIEDQLRQNGDRSDGRRR